MKQLFDELKGIVDADTNDVSLLLNKLYEETGELAQVINKTLGRKRKKSIDTEINIRNNIIEEIVDSIQCLFTIAQVKNISYEEICLMFMLKNRKYKKGLNTDK